MPKDNLDARIARLKKDFKRLLEENESEVIDDYIYTEQRETAWVDSERYTGYNFTKRIATPLPTKQRRRVTLRKVTGSPRLKFPTVQNRLMDTAPIESGTTTEE